MNGLLTIFLEINIPKDIANMSPIKVTIIIEIFVFVNKVIVFSLHSSERLLFNFKSSLLIDSIFEKVVNKSSLTEFILL